jgi:hypothetical protein
MDIFVLFNVVPHFSSARERERELEKLLHIIIIPLCTWKKYYCRMLAACSTYTIQLLNESKRPLVGMSEWVREKSKWHMKNLRDAREEIFSAELVEAFLHSTVSVPVIINVLKCQTLLKISP